MEPFDRDRLARESLPHVERIIAEERRKLGIDDPVISEEMRSYALEGLASALDRFDSSRNVKFRFFATPRIRGAIYDGLSQSGWLPRRVYRKIKYYQKLAWIVRSYAEEPPPGDTVETVHRLASTFSELTTAYVTTYAADTEEVGDVSRTSSHTPPQAHNTVEQQQMRQILLSHLGTLPERQYRLVFDYYFKDMTLPEIAEQMGISKGWASKLLRSALANLRASLEQTGELKKL